MFLAAARIGIPEALSYSLIGFLIVFTVLVALMLVINVITRSAGAFAKKAEPTDAPAAAAPVPAANAGMAPAPGSVGECDLHTVDDRTAAMLMAIVADDSKAPLNTLRFTSIREIQDSEGDGKS